MKYITIISDKIIKAGEIKEEIPLFQEERLADTLEMSDITLFQALNS